MAEDDGGPETPDEDKPVTDAEPTNGSSIAAQAEEEAPLEPEEPAMQGDGQLSLAGLGLARRTAVVSHVAFQSARKEIEGRMDPNRDHVFVVKGRVAGANVDYTRADDNAEVSSAAAAQKVRPVAVRRVAPSLEAVVMQLGALDPEVQEEVAGRLATVLEEYVPEEEHERTLALA